MKAIWNNTIIAESDETIVVEGNHYFPSTDRNPIGAFSAERNTYDMRLEGRSQLLQRHRQRRSEQRRRLVLPKC